MTTPERIPDGEIFLRGARGDEFAAYAALVAEADALHHQHLPDLIKPPDRARPREEDFLSCLTDPDQLLDVAVAQTDTGQMVVGFVQATKLDRDEGRAHEPNRVVRIELVVVREAFRRRRIGKRLMTRVRAWADAKQAQMIVLHSYAFNSVAGRLYEKSGFNVQTKMYALPLA